MTDGARLLIADDDDGIRGLLTAFFRKKGFEVTGVADGRAALEALCVGSIDVAILDVMMPGMTGLQVLEEARESGVKAAIVIATAHGDSDAVVQGLELGADDWVAKPFDLAILHARIVVRLRNARQAPLFAPPPTTSSPVDDKPFVAEEGAILDGRYELQRPIGRGSFGVVWRARHRGLEADVAVKLLNVGAGDGGTERLEPAKRQAVSTFEERSDELRLEGVRAARVQHPHAVRVLDVGALKDGTPYLVMELLQGPTVEDELRSGPVSLLRAIGILVPVAEALAAAHAQGVIHRDVKPANVMLHRGAAGEVVKVFDFGVAKLVNVGVEGPGGHLTGASEVSSRVVAGSPTSLRSACAAFPTTGAPTSTPSASCSTSCWSGRCRSSAKMAT